MQKLLRLRTPLLGIGFAILIFSCQQKKEVPYPENSSGLETPKAVPFKIPDPVPFQWNNYVEKLPQPKVMDFEMDKLPSKPFNTPKEKALLTEISKTPIDWESSTEIPFKLIPEIDNLEPRIIPIPEPTIFEFIPPSRWNKSNHAMLQLSDAQGFPGQRIVAQIRDHQGNLWFSTNQGIVKYTNNEYLLYDIIDLVDDDILDLNLDSRGRIILSTFTNGFMILDPLNNYIEEYSMPFGFVRMTVDSEGLIWGGCVESGTRVIDLEKGTVSKVDFTNTSFVGGFHTNVFHDPSGHILIGNFLGLAIVRPGREKINVFEDRGRGVFDFTPLESGDIVFNNFEPGIVSISFENNTFNYIGPEQGFEHEVIGADVDEMGNLWISSDSSITCYNPNEKTLKTMITNAAVAPPNGAPSISFYDNNGMYWIGTLSDGFILYDTQGMDSYMLTAEDGLVDNNVWDIMEDTDKRLWFATYGGINIYDPKTDRIKNLMVPESLGSNIHVGLNLLNDSTLLVGSQGGFSIVNLNQETVHVYNIPETDVPNSRTIVWRALQLTEDKILMTSNKGLLQFDRKAGSLQSLQVGDALEESLVYDLIQEDNGDIWIASTAGASVIDLSEQTISTMTREHGLTNQTISIIVSTSKNEIAIGTLNGLSIISPDRSEITNITEANGLYPRDIYDMVEVNGRLQLGTGDGIVVIDRDGDNWGFSNFGKPEGIEYTDFNQTTGHMSSDGRVWWAATPSVLVNANDPKTNTGTEARVFLSDLKIMDQTPQFYQSTNISDSAVNSSSRKYLQDNSIKWDSVDNRSGMPYGLVLPHHQNSLTFNYFNPTIRSRDDVRYRYVLEGSDEGWSKVSRSSTSKTYFNLVPGDYAFKVITAGQNNKWSQPTEFSFTIKPPWWATWWAYTVYGLFFVGSVFFSTQARSNYLKRKNKTLEEQVNHRTSQLQQSIEDLKSTQEQLIHSEKMASLGELTAGIAHEIQNPLNFVNNFSEVNKELIDDLKEAIGQNDQEEIKLLLSDLVENEDKVMYHGKRAEQIVKSMLQHSRGTEGKKEPTDINSLCDEYLRLAYHGFRAKDKSFNADFDLELDESLGEIHVVPQDMGRVLLNLINNAFQAVGEADKPRVTVKTKKNGEKAVIKVIDNGSGIPDEVRDKIFQPFFTTKPSGQGTGLGLSMSYEIVTKGHNGQLEVNSEIGKGTEFMIILPLTA